MSLTPKKIAIRGPNWLGDHVMAWGFYHKIARDYPQAERVLYVPPGLRSLATHGLFTQVKPIEPASKQNVWRQWKFARELKRESFDLAFILPASFRAVLPFALAGIPQRIGFSGFENSWALTQSIPWGGVKSGQHKSALYESLLATPAVRKAQKIDSNRVERRGIVLAPGASIALREWPYFPQLAEALASSMPDTPLRVVGSLQDRRVSDWVAKFRPGLVQNCIGKTNLEELVGLLSTQQLIVANDSGVAHLAARFTDTPIVVLFGPGDPNYVAPLAGQVAIVRDKTLRCSPCESPRCRAPFGYQACLKQVSVAEVLSHVQSLMGN